MALYDRFHVPGYSTWLFKAPWGAKMPKKIARQVRNAQRRFRYWRKTNGFN